MKPSPYLNRFNANWVIPIITLCVTSLAFAEGDSRFIQVKALDKNERSAIANHGMSIENVKSDSVWGFANPEEIAKLRADGFQILGDFDMNVGRGGHEMIFSFPPEDSRFHTYDQNYAALKDLETKNSAIARVQSIGKSIENRDIWAFHLNTNAESLKSGTSTKPGIIFMGNHHAREHVSLEIPLMLATYLTEHQKDARIAKLLDSRDIWIIPMVNPDGAEYDISTGNYKMWRKNRKNNGDGTFGVDLNRNYGYKWGTGGSSSSTSSDIYMGKKPFSEPETTVIKDFVESHLNAKILLSFHTFSELILYPWGNTNDKIANTAHLAAYENMARTMAKWNHYEPEQSSDLYIASGDTCDWAYGAHGIFSFTFELSPRSPWEGGFYPGQDVLDKVFNDNLEPALYLIDLADNPLRASNTTPTDGLSNYVQPTGPSENFLANPTLENFSSSRDPK